MRCGKAPRLIRPIAITWCLITGIGSGTGVAASWPTTESMVLIFVDGDCKSTSLFIRSAPVVAIGSTTIKKRLIHKQRFGNSKVANRSPGNICPAISMVMRHCWLLRRQRRHGIGWLGCVPIYDKSDKLIFEGKGTSSGQPEHLQNFVDAIRTNNPDRLNQHISSGHRSTLLCHLGNIAYRTGRSVKSDPKNGHILNDAEQQALWRREYNPSGKSW